ncbi:unnamed protein product, partial [Acidithrix sp. C25]
VSIDSSSFFGLEVVANVSEGQRQNVIDEIAVAGGTSLLDLHSDPYHNRSVFSLYGRTLRDDLRSLAIKTIEKIDIASHHGVHPRIGSLDVVPFVWLNLDLGISKCTEDDARQARDLFATWLWEELSVPSYLYGTGRTLPRLRSDFNAGQAPDIGDLSKVQRSGAVAVGERGLLVAYNLIVEETLESAKSIAAQLRSKYVRTLALEVGGSTQISANLIEPLDFGPIEFYRAVAKLTKISSSELVGLVPSINLSSMTDEDLRPFGLSKDKTIEAALQRQGLIQ